MTREQLIETLKKADHTDDVFLEVFQLFLDFVKPAFKRPDGSYDWRTFDSVLGAFTGYGPGMIGSWRNHTGAPILTIDSAFESLIEYLDRVEDGRAHQLEAEKERKDPFYGLVKVTLEKKSGKTLSAVSMYVRPNREIDLIKSIAEVARLLEMGKL